MSTTSPPRRAYTVAALAFALAAALVLALPAAADDDVDTFADCGLLAVADDGGPSCRDEAQELHATRVADPSCRIDVDAIFYAGTDWLRLSDALAAADLPCGSYAVSVPALANNKMGLRVLQDDEVRKRGIEPLAEVNLGGPRSWDEWRAANGKTWFDVGVQFRRTMAAAGYAPGERWSVNELDYATIRDPNRRANMRDLLRGLYYGDIGMPPLQGIVLLGVPFRQQNIPNVDAYRHDLQEFLADDDFWRDVDAYAQWFGNEVYADTRNWGVDGSSRNERRRHLDDYMFHLLDLAETGPAEAAVARDVLERKYLPMGNAIWRARGGEKFNPPFSAGAGNTVVDSATMQRFVSEQVHAIRSYQGSHPHRAPAGAIAFAWQPCNRPTADVAGCPTQDAGFIAGLDAIAARLAASIGNAYRQGGASPTGACHAPGSDVDWCDGAAVPGAAFTDAWADFRWAD